MQDRRCIMPDLTGRPRVLIVDDERVIADTLALILNKNGFATHVAYNGEQAVMLAEHLPPDILITDLVMNGMSGIQAALEVCAHAPQCRTILVSGLPLSEELLREVEAFGLGCEIMAKPIQPRELLERLKMTD